MGIETFISKVCVQTAVYWGNPRPDGYGGMIYDSPREIKCRWDIQERIVLGQLGLEYNQDVEILVTEDLQKHGRIWLGSLNDLDSDTQPDDMSDFVPEIIKFKKVSMPKSLTQFVRTISISKYK